MEGGERGGGIVFVGVDSFYLGRLWVRVGFGRVEMMVGGSDILFGEYFLNFLFG